MKSWQTIFLKIVVFIGLIPVFFFNFYQFPLFLIEGFKSDFYLAKYLIIIIFSFYLMLVPYLLILFNIFKLIVNMEKNQLFNDETSKSFSLITKFSYIITFLFVVDLPFFYLIADYEDAPGLILFGLLLTGVSFTFGVFASVLKNVINKEKEVNLNDGKSENVNR